MAKSCCEYSSWWNYSKPVSFDFEEKELAILSLFTTTTVEKSINNTLAEELGDLFDECCQDGWDYDGKHPAKAISPSSINYAIGFISFLENIEKPMVVPYFDGSVGFEWNINNEIIITVVFKEDKKMIFSVLTSDRSEYGEYKNNSINKQSLSNKICELLNHVQ